MLTPITKTRRTDDVQVIKWEMGSDGTDIYNYLVAELPAAPGGDWEVSLVTWRTVSALNVDGVTGFSLDRGEYLARGADGTFFRLNDESLRLLFN